MSERRYCTFHVGGLLIGVAIEQVEEVRRAQAVVPVPLAHADVAGLLNLRGQIVTAIDARRRLGLCEQREGNAPTIVVIRSAGEAVGLLVDREGEVVLVAEDRVREVPETVGAAMGALAVGAYQVEGDLLLLLDPDRVVTVSSL